MFFPKIKIQTSWCININESLVKSLYQGASTSVKPLRCEIVINNTNTNKEKHLSL